MAWKELRNIDIQERSIITYKRPNSSLGILNRESQKIYTFKHEHQVMNFLKTKVTGISMLKAHAREESSTSNKRGERVAETQKSRQKSCSQVVELSFIGVDSTGGSDDGSDESDVEKALAPGKLRGCLSWNTGTKDTSR